MPAQEPTETAVAPDYGMLANAQLRDRGPRYTETPADPYAPDAPMVAEPYNAVTAALFIVIVLEWAWRLRGRYRDYPFLVSCMPILLVGGIGGTLYHGFRTRSLYFFLDVIPIQLLVLAGAVYLAVRLWHRRGWLYLGGAVLVNLAVGALLFTLVAPRSRQVAVNLNYAALAVSVILPIVMVLIRTRFRHAGWVAAGLTAFVIAWFFRLVDERAGPYLPMGTHWLWHLFGAISTALIIEYFYNVESEELTPTGKPATAE